MKAMIKTIGCLVLAWMLATAGTGFAQNIAPLQTLFSGIPSGAALPVQAGPISMNAADMASLQRLSDVQLNTFLNALGATPQLSFDALPRNGMGGTFYSLQHPEWPPLPGDCHGSPVWQMNDFYLLNDLNFDYQALPQSRSLMRAMDGVFPPNGDGPDGPGLDNPPDISNYLKYQAQSFLVLDTNAIAAIDTNLFNALSSFSNDNGTDPVLQVKPYQGNCLLFKASHFDYSGESDRDFALIVNDKLETPVFNSVDLLNSPTNQNGWLIQGVVSRYKVADPMFLLVSNISRAYNAFFRVIPYSGPVIQISGANDYDTVTGFATLQASITDLSGVTDRQIAVLVDGLPARYSLGASNTISIDTRYAPNGIEPVSVIAGNAGALLFDPSNPSTDNKLFYQNTASVLLDFENSIYLTFAGDESSSDVGTNYIEFTVNQAEYISGQISDPTNGRVVLSYSGYVPSASTIAFPWDFNEADGVTPYTNDTYIFTFSASTQALSNDGGRFSPRDAGSTTTLTITNGIGKQGVRTGGYCILNYETEDPSTTDGATVNYFDQQWGDNLEFAYESLYSWQFGSLPQYSTGDIGPNRSNPSSPHLPFAVDSGNQTTWLSFLQSMLSNRAYSDFNYGPGHSDGYYIGSGPKPPGLNYVETIIGVDQVEPLAVGNGGNWRMRKVCMWGCDTGNKKATRGYHGWPEAFGIRDTALQTHSWTKKNVGLFFLDEVPFQPYGTPGVSLSEVAMDFDTIWIDGPMAFPGGCDPTYSFQFAVASAVGMYPQLTNSKPDIRGFPYLPYSCVYDDELMLNDISHVKTSFHW